VVGEREKEAREREKKARINIARWQQAMLKKRELPQAFFLNANILEKILPRH
jgi:hypothetical protein